MSEAALSGRIDAVGLPELLRIPMSTKRTGTLTIVSNDPTLLDAEARFHYVDGALIAGSLGSKTGEEAFRGILAWRDGVFEFTSTTAMPAAVDHQLHAVVVQELKAWYASRTSGRAPAGADRVGSTPQSLPAPAAPTSGVPTSAAPRPAAREHAADGHTSTRPPPSALLGSGKVDGWGNLSELSGQLSMKEGALGFAIQQLAIAMGKDMGLGAPHRIEVHGKGERWLGVGVRGEGAVVVVVHPEARLADELERNA